MLTGRHTRLNKVIKLNYRTVQWVDLNKELMMVTDIYDFAEAKKSTSKQVKTKHQILMSLN